VADDQASLSEQVLNVAEAEVETKVQPPGVSDDLGREAVAVVGRLVSGLGDEPRISDDAYRRSALNLTTP
jgi:hypothetical protein